MGRLWGQNRALERQKGLTLIEVLVVVGIIAILLGIGIPYISSQNAELRSTVRSLRSHLMEARLEALKQYTRVKFCVHTTGYNATTDRGDVLFVSDFPDSVSASSDDIAIYFKPLGSASNMSFEVYSTAGESYSVSVSAVGNVKVVE
ncbi:MAG: GspH/FimT family pseudopilin [Desulfohalobium sp.]